MPAKSCLDARTRPDVQRSVSGVTWAELPKFITTLAVTVSQLSECAASGCDLGKVTFDRRGRMGMSCKGDNSGMIDDATFSFLFCFCSFTDVENGRKLISPSPWVAEARNIL